MSSRSSGVTAGEPYSVSPRSNAPAECRQDAVVASSRCSSRRSPTGKTSLLIVAGTFIAWALITAIFIPKRNSGLPAAR